MSAKTGIQWTDATWNPVVGCTQVSPGCAHCYAKQLHDQRYEAYHAGKKIAPQYGLPFETVQMRYDRLELPLSWRKPRRVFVNSVSDLFHETVPNEFIAEVFSVMVRAERHTFQVLTKRPHRMLAFLRDVWPHSDARGNLPIRFMGGPSLVPANVWLGVSVENQRMANERIPLLAQTPAAIRFLSCEPLLGPLDFYECGSRGGEDGDPFAFSALAGTDACDPPIPGIDWVIVGGEQTVAEEARRFELQWASDVFSACERAGVARFAKQGGTITTLGGEPFTVGGKLGNLERYPEWFRVREFPREVAHV